MEVRIIFKDATAEKVFKNADNVYTKVACWLFVREIGYLNTPPLTDNFSVVHKHGNHWGSNSHRVGEGLEQYVKR